MIIRSSIILCCILSIAFESTAQTFKDVTYTEDNTNFANPERGFYHHTETRSSDYGLLNESTLRNYRTEGITMIMRVFYLESFVSAPISQTYLDNVRQDLNTARKAGVKVIVRFAYTSNSSKPFGDAPPDRVLQHIKQLGPILRENVDVIAVMQAGFIGAWGEWYYTDYFSQQVGNPSEADWVNRRNVVNAMLAELPADRSIQVRTPDIKRKLVQSTTALTQGEAFANTARARLGHHNDCFLASPDDYGTYIDPADEKPYLEAETQYLPMGGETCGVSVPLSECPNALAQMQKFHWSFVNRDYHPEVVGGWNTNGCFDDVQKKLGYRFRLKTAHLQETSKPNGQVNFSIAFANDGWASPYNKRNVEIVLRNTTSNKEYRLKLTDDPRKWLPSNDIALSVEGGLPANIEEGEYKVFLDLSSPEFGIKKRSDYSIRLANTGAWEESTGYNYLNHTLVVSSGASVPTYSGANFFLSSDEMPETLPAASPLIGSVFGNNVLLYWGWEDNDNYRVIQRSDDGGDFETIATLPSDVFSFMDKSLTASSNYSYRSYATDGSAMTPMTDVVQVTTGTTTPPYYTHRTDGDIDEWVSVRPLRTLWSNDQTIALKLFADKDSLYYQLRGDFETFQLSIDADNSGEFDNTLSDGIRSGINVEGAVLLDDLENLGDNTMIPVSLTADDDQLPVVAFIRSLPPSPLSDFKVEVTGPSRLIVSWQACTTCLGVVVERSTSPTSGFEVVKEITNSTYIFYDTDVVTDQMYYYRAAGYNEVGLAEYTAVVSAKPSVVTGLLDGPRGAAVIYPNPISDVMTLRWQPGDRAITMFDAIGRIVTPGLLHETHDERKYDVSALASGLYIVVIKNDRGTNAIRVKK